MFQMAYSMEIFNLYCKADFGVDLQIGIYYSEISVEFF